MKTLLAALCVTAAALSGCAVPVYNNVEPHYASPRSARRPVGPVIVHFESMLPGKRFDETVCDNVVGVFWSSEESRKIGFTQNPGEIIAKTTPILVMEASLPGNVGIGRVASGQSSLVFDKIKIDSRIMVPFGAYISRNTEQLLGTASPSSKVCFDAECVRQAAAGMDGARIVSVHFTKFSVSEDNPNKLTLFVEGRITHGMVGGQASELKFSTVDRPLTSEGYTHNGVLRVMNALANEAASAVADQIFSAVQ